MSTRRLVLKSGVWRYRVGCCFAVLYSPSGRRTIVACGTLTGRDFERGQWKRTRDGTVLPSDVRRYIEKDLPG